MYLISCINFEYDSHMKICSHCRLTKKDREFGYRNKAKQILRSHCKSCAQQYIRGHYVRYKTYYLAKAKKRNKEVRNAIRQYIWHYLSEHNCIDCGESDPIVLEFDHRSDKVKDVASTMYSHSLQKVIDEIEKCDVRCANCHRRKTALQFGWFKTKIAPVA